MILFWTSSCVQPTREFWIAAFHCSLSIMIVLITVVLLSPESLFRVLISVVWSGPQDFFPGLPQYHLASSELWMCHAVASKLHAPTSKSVWKPWKIATQINICDMVLPGDVGVSSQHSGIHPPSRAFLSLTLRAQTSHPNSNTLCTVDTLNLRFRLMFMHAWLPRTLCSEQLCRANHARALLILIAFWVEAIHAPR